MNAEKIINDLIKEEVQAWEERKALPAAELELIKTTEKALQKRIRETMQAKKYAAVIEHMSTIFQKDFLLKDGNTKDVYITSFSHQLFPMHRIGIITDAETKIMLYAETGPGIFVTIKEFFAED